jgi:hypothetical protein
MTMKTLSIAAAALLLAAGAANAQQQNKPSGVNPGPNNAWQLPAAGSGGASSSQQDAKKYNQNGGVAQPSGTQQPTDSTKPH